MMAFQNKCCTDPEKTSTCHTNYMNELVEKCNFKNMTINAPDILDPTRNVIEMFCDTNTHKFSECINNRLDHFSMQFLKV